MNSAAALHDKLARKLSEARERIAALEKRLAGAEAGVSNAQDQGCRDLERRLRESESWFRAAQDLSLDAFTILEALRDETGAIVDFVWTYANPVAERILKRPASELIGNRLLRVLPGNRENSELFESYVRIVETGEPHDIELHYQSEGIDGWFRNMAVKLGDGVAVSFSDITGRKHMERQRELSLSRLEALVRLQAMTEATTQELARYVLREGARLTGSGMGVLGLVDEDEQSLSAYYLTDVDDPESSFCNPPETLSVADGGLWSAGLREREPYILNDYSQSDQYKKGCPAGHTPLTRFLSVPVFDEGRIVLVGNFANKAEAYERSDVHQITLLLGGMWDILKQRRGKEDLLAAKAAAEAANRAKSEFLANMSHEIRTPMNGVIGLTELALMSCREGRTREYLGLIKKSGATLLDIINDILDLAKIEAGKVELEEEPFDPRDDIEFVLRALGASAQEKGLRFVRTVDPDIPARLLGDSARLRQVLTNLVGNAIKYTRKGLVSLSVRLAGDEPSRPDGLRLLFQVRDTGIGIPADRLADIFESFAQVSGPQQVWQGGTGLGLAISRRLVELMGGRIWVESEPGKGSTFFFTAEFGLPESARERGRTPEPDREAAPPLRILLVEDNEINTLLATELLAAKGHAVRTVGDGARALEALREEPFDLVLMDARMPGMDGLEATRRIRAGEAGDPAVPIVALTAYALKGDRERFLDAGMDDYLSKPIDLDALDRVLAVIARKGGGEWSG